MTSGAVGALIIYNHLLGKDSRRDTTVQSGMAWLASNFSVTENVGPPQVDKQNGQTFLYYYLYALERVGMLNGSPKIGTAATQLTSGSRYRNPATREASRRASAAYQKK